MELYILRHGKAEARSSIVKSDAKRKLTEEGKKELQEISKAIKKFGIKFDMIISSPLLRAQQTADIVSKSLSIPNKKTIIWDELKPESDVALAQKRIISLKPDATVMIVGHEPHLTTLISTIISNSQTHVNINLKKGGFVHLRVSNTKSKILGTLRSILTPKQMKLCK